MAASDQVRALRWDGAALQVLDQRLLPAEERWLIARDATETARVIHDMAVRGAPAIGLAGAYGLVMAARALADADADAWTAGLAAAVALLNAARPTAVSLAAALHHLERIARQGSRATGAHWNRRRKPCGMRISQPTGAWASWAATASRPARAS